MKRWLGIELLFVHAGHALLFVLALPLVVFSFLFWLYEATFVLPIARRLVRGEVPGDNRK